MNPAIMVFVLASLHLGHSHITSQSQYTQTPSFTPPQYSRPYSFEHTAGHFSGHVDRDQKAYGNDAGRVYGSPAYLPPKYNGQRVEYKADNNQYQNPFLPAGQPSWNNYNNYHDFYTQPQDTEAVRLAKNRHYDLFARIADYNAQPATDTPSVEWEKAKHHYLYNKIAAEHAAIGAERAEGLFQQPRGSYRGWEGYNKKPEWNTWKEGWSQYEPRGFTHKC